MNSFRRVREIGARFRRDTTDGVNKSRDRSSSFSRTKLRESVSFSIGKTVHSTKGEQHTTRGV